MLRTFYRYVLFLFPLLYDTALRNIHAVPMFHFMQPTRCHHDFLLQVSPYLYTQPYAASMLRPAD